MVIDISKILKSPGENMSFSGEIGIDDNFFEQYRFSEISPLFVKGIVKNISGVIVLECDCEFSYNAPCDRCGEDVGLHQRFSFFENFVKSDTDENDTDAMRLEGNTIDLKDIAERETFANIPLKNLCREDCKGLCLKCGANLNNSSCNCRDDEWNPQFEILKGLFD